MTAGEDLHADADDERLIQRATTLGRVLVSQDTDMLVITNDWAGQGRQFSGLFYSHPIRVTIGQAIQDLELAAQVLEPTDMRNRIEFLPL